MKTEKSIEISKEQLIEIIKNSEFLQTSIILNIYEGVNMVDRHECVNGFVKDIYTERKMTLDFNVQVSRVMFNDNGNLININETEVNTIITRFNK